MLQINHVLFDQDEQKTAEIVLNVDYKETWQNEKSELLQKMLGERIIEQIKSHLDTIYDNANVNLVNEFEAKLLLKQVKYLDRAIGTRTVEGFISLVDEVLNDDYTGLDPVKVNESTTPATHKKIYNCGVTLARILEDHYSDPSYDLDVLGEVD